MDNVITLRELYKNHRRMNKKNTFYRVEYNQLKEEFETYLSWIFSEMYKGRKVDMFFGSLLVSGIKRKVHKNETAGMYNAPVNWKETKKLKEKGINKIVYYDNDHTQGYSYAFRCKTHYLLKNMKWKKLYLFRVSKNHKRLLNKLILGGSNYIHE